MDFDKIKKLQSMLDIDLSRADYCAECCSKINFDHFRDQNTKKAYDLTSLCQLCQDKKEVPNEETTSFTSNDDGRMCSDD